MGRALVGDRGASAAGVICYPGGTLVEMALRVGKLPEMLDWAHKAGFDGLEVCDGVIEMSDELRADTIGAAVKQGFRVSTVVQEAIRKPVVEIVPLRNGSPAARRISRPAPSMRTSSSRG